MGRCNRVIKDDAVDSLKIERAPLMNAVGMRGRL